MAKNKQETILFANRDALLPQRTMEEIFTDDKKYKEKGLRPADRTQGELNWHCPCVANAVSAPCGAPFRAFMTCVDKLVGPGDVKESKKSGDREPYFCDAEREWMSACMRRNSAYYEPLLRRLNVVNGDAQ